MALSPILISAKGLSKYITGTPSGQRKVLRDYKYQKDEGLSQALFYKEARDTIVKFHKHKKPTYWLLGKADALEAKAKLEHGKRAIQFKSNARGIREYAGHFGNKSYVVLEKMRMKLSVENVIVNAVPDMVVEEKGVIKLVKLDFSKKELNDKLIKTVCQIFFEAQKVSGYNFKGSSIQFIDVPRGKVYNPARSTSRIKADISAACKSISDLWDGI